MLNTLLFQLCLNKNQHTFAKKKKNIAPNKTGLLKSEYFESQYQAQSLAQQQYERQSSRKTNFQVKCINNE